MSKHNQTCKPEYTAFEDKLFALGVLVTLIALMVTAGLSLLKAIITTIALIVIVLVVGVAIQIIKKPKRGITFNRSSGVAK